jgi:hypothetical protein
MAAAPGKCFADCRAMAGSIGASRWGGWHVRIVGRTMDAMDPGYREQALKIYPWICGRCGREFTSSNLRELTVHHRDHNHSNNPPDGSNWELLCVYCHDNEHQKQLEAAAGNVGTNAKQPAQPATHSPFANLRDLMNKK